MEPLTQTWWGLVIHTFCSSTNREHAKPNFVIFHNGRRWNFDFCQQRWNPWPKLVGGEGGAWRGGAWGVGNRHFYSRTNRECAKPNFVIFIMAEGEILISINNDATLDLNLWGVGKWHFCSRTNRECAKPNFVIFHNGRRWKFDSRRQRWNPWPKLVGGGGVGNWHFCSRTNRECA